MSKYLMLDAATATGAGSAIGFKQMQENVTFQVDITGAPTAVTVDIEGSVDGTPAAQLAQHAMTAGELTATTAIFHISGKPVGNVQANVTALTGGTSPTVTVLMFD